MRRGQQQKRHEIIIEEKILLLLLYVLDMGNRRFDKPLIHVAFRAMGANYIPVMHLLPVDIERVVPAAREWPDFPHIALPKARKPMLIE